MWVHVLMDNQHAAWRQWNQFRGLTENNPKIGVGK